MLTGHETGASLSLGEVRCGVRSQPRSTRVIGGKPATPGQFPWAVSLRKKISGKYQHLCAGSLLTSRHVVTAAHCLHKTSSSDWSLVAGEFRPDQLDSGEQTLQVSQIKRHPQYKHPFKQFDIALLKLSEDVVWSDLIAPVCLPSNDQETKQLDAVISGWGNDAPISDGGKPSKMLMFASLPIISNEKCKKWYLDLNTPSTIYTSSSIKDTHMCTGVPEGGRDGCKGDSGGGLTVETGDQSVLVGITSAGYKCGLPRVPAIYTRVSQFVSWLQDEVAD